MATPPIERIKNAFPRCDWSGCGRRPRPWSFLQGNREGVRLHDHWYCGAACFEKAACVIFTELLRVARKRQSKHHRVPIGLLLYSQGLVTQDDLQAALKLQRECGGRVGEWLRQCGAVNENQVTTALATQWSRPIFPLDDLRHFLECAGLVPLPLLESVRMAPVHWVPGPKLLYMAFAESIDYAALHTIEQMLACRTEACLTPESALDRALEELRRHERPPEFVFDSATQPQEMAAIARSYAQQLCAEEAQIAACGEYLWVRFQSTDQVSNLLFKIWNHR